MSVFNKISKHSQKASDTILRVGPIKVGGLYKEESCRCDMSFVVGERQMKNRKL